MPPTRLDLRKCTGTTFLSTLLLGDDLDGHARVDFGTQMHGDLVRPDAPDRLGQVDLAAIQRRPRPGLQLLGQVVYRDAPEEAAVLAGPRLHPDRGGREPPGHRLPF